MAESGALPRNDQESTNAFSATLDLDRIGELPESLICHILSFLPLKDAVSTSILSQTWRKLWTLVLDIVLNDDDYLRPSNGERSHSRSPRNPDKPLPRFSDMVNSVLTQRKGLRIKKFDLFNVCEPCDQSQINNWVSAAKACNVEEMDLHVYRKEIDYIYLSPNFFTCDSIVVLKLSGIIALHNLTSVYLPKLKYFFLDLYRYKDIGTSLDEFLSGCPVLEELFLTLTRCPEFSINICVPSLKWLRISYLGDMDSQIQLNTLSLEFFGMTADHLPRCSGDILQNLVKTNFVIRESVSAHRLAKLMRIIHKAKFLRLVGLRSVVHLNEDLPELPNMVRLDIQLFSWQGVMNLVQKCLKLEDLFIYHRDELVFPMWTEPMRVPDCIASTLTEVYYGPPEYTEDGLNAMAYFLENANFLKKMRIEYTGLGTFVYGDYKRHLEKLSTLLQQRSDGCKLVFDGSISCS